MLTILITTSRRPSRRTRSFLKELTSVLPASVRVSRGKMTLRDLQALMLSLKAMGAIIVYERRGNPSALAYYEDTGRGLRRVLLVKLGSVKLRRELNDTQKPMNVSHVLIRYDETLRDFINAFVRMLNAKVYTEGEVEESPVDAVEVLLTHGEGQRILVRFICTGSNRVCGPQLTIEEVIRY